MSQRTIIVTGARGALGSAAAHLAEAGGACVAMIDHAAIEADFGPAGAHHIRLGGVDLTDFSATQKAMDDIAARTGRIDALLNIAGGFAWQTIADGDVVGWERMFAINLKTALNASKAALPHLLKSQEGAIVNVGALGALKAGAGMGAYAASKSGVMRLTESMAEELKGKVRVNAVLPSIIDTPANRASMPDADYSAWVSTEDLARVLLFLASSDARAITGALVPVSGRV